MFLIHPWFEVFFSRKSLTWQEFCLTEEGAATTDSSKGRHIVASTKSTVNVVQSVL